MVKQLKHNIFRHIKEETIRNSSLAGRQEQNIRRRSSRTLEVKMLHLQQYIICRLSNMFAKLRRWHLFPERHDTRSPSPLPSLLRNTKVQNLLFPTKYGDNFSEISVVTGTSSSFPHRTRDSNSGQVPPRDVAADSKKEKKKTPVPRIICKV